MKNDLKGVRYFPYSVDFYQDEKAIGIQSAFGQEDGDLGLAALTVVSWLLTELYKVGYCFRWDDSAKKGLAWKMRCSPEFVGDVVEKCLEVGWFDRELYERRGVLSSEGIQRRYCRVLKQSPEKCIKSHHLLIEAPENSENLRESPRKAVNKIKLNKIKLSSVDDKAPKKSKKRSSLKTKKLPSGETVTCLADDAHLSPEAPAHLTRIKDELKPRDPDRRVWLSDSQWESLLESCGGNTIGGNMVANDYVGRLSGWAEGNPEGFLKRKSHLQTIKNWMRSDKEREAKNDR